MIYQDIQITVNQGLAVPDKALYIFRGDSNIILNFKLVTPQYMISKNDKDNLVTRFGVDNFELRLQLERGYDRVIRGVITKDGYCRTQLTGEVIQSLLSGVYTYQITLIDDDNNAVMTFPPCINKLNIRDRISTNARELPVPGGLSNEAMADLSLIAENGEVLEAFDNNGNYIKTNWSAGDIISSAKLNKIEEAINVINQNEKNDVDILNEQLDEVTSQLAHIENKNANINVLDYGAKGDGVTDDTIAFVNCFNHCVDNGLTMFIPNGTYIVNQKLTKSSSITSIEAEKVVRIIGESPYGVFIETTEEISPIIDVSRSKYVFIQNLFSKSTWFHVVQYGGDFRSFSRLRDVYISNVGCISRDKCLPSWNLFINTPSPSDYNREEVDSYYTRYAMEITNNSGYNPIMINNFPNTNDDGSEGYPSDQSAIGIIDEVRNATGAILIEGGKRSFYQCKNNEYNIASDVRQGLVYEVDSVGHIAIGCSTQNNETVAPGIATVKLRDNYPIISFYDTSSNNRRSVIGSNGNDLVLRGYNANGNYSVGLTFNTATGVAKLKGSLQQGEKLTWENGRSAGISGNGIVTIHIPENVIGRLESISNGVEGQTISILSEGSFTINHNKDGWGNIRTSTNTDMALTKNTLYLLVNVNGKWYLK